MIIYSQSRFICQSSGIQSKLVYLLALQVNIIICSIYNRQMDIVIQVRILIIHKNTWRLQIDHVYYNIIQIHVLQFNTNWLQIGMAKSQG